MAVSFLVNSFQKLLNKAVRPFMNAVVKISRVLDVKLFVRNVEKLGEPKQRTASKNLMN